MSSTVTTTPAAAAAAAGGSRLAPLLPALVDICSEQLAAEELLTGLTLVVLSRVPPPGHPLSVLALAGRAPVLVDCLLTLERRLPVPATRLHPVELGAQWHPEPILGLEKKEFEH